MIYFRNAKFPIESKETVEQLLNQSTSKILTFFDLIETSTHVKPAGRLFAGKRLETGEVLISRYRPAFFKLAPRLVTKWKIEYLNGITYLVTQTRLSILSTIALLIFSAALLIPLLKFIATFDQSNVERILLPLIIVGILVGLTRYEITATDNAIKKVMANQN